MNGIIVNVCTTVWMMTVVGSVLFGCWGLLYRFFDRPGQIKAVYYALRLVLVFYLVPVATLLLWLEDYDFATDSTEGYFFTFTPGILQAPSGRPGFGWPACPGCCSPICGNCVGCESCGRAVRRQRIPEGCFGRRAGRSWGSKGTF